ncbi:hypothetical protein [Moraxella oblonga]|uniref:hypothetical protein n=1 Tax=Moraxella oblonga TaxID=200413 RepID=UPI00082BD3CF|nr:hypothetical protein [Moraxella oblonga]
MNIFDNDSEVLQIGALTIENQTDCVVISGDVEINQDQVGKEQAQALYDFAKALLDKFGHLGELPECIEKPVKASTQVTNPFE